MLERDQSMDIPAQQRMVRKASLAKEHMQEHQAALQRAVALDVPRAYSPSSYGTFRELEQGENSGKSRRFSFTLSKTGKESWDDLAGQILPTDKLV